MSALFIAMEEAVRQAFVDRPHLVDGAASGRSSPSCCRALQAPMRSPAPSASASFGATVIAPLDRAIAASLGIEQLETGRNRTALAATMFDTEHKALA